MRRTAGTIAGMLLLLAGCGGDATTDEPELDVAADWAGDEIAIEVDTNLPDGAVLSWAAFDGDGDDAAHVVGDDLTVAGGTASGTIDVTGFGGDDAELEVSFLPGYRAQPDEITSSYEPNEGATVTVPVSRG